VQNYLKDQCADQIDIIDWMIHWMDEGFSAIETRLSNMTARDESCLTAKPGLFECFLVPQVYNAERFGTDMTRYPMIGNMVTRCRGQAAFIDAAPENQPDAVAV
jgi:hypothetical protein